MVNLVREAQESKKKIVLSAIVRRFLQSKAEILSIQRA